MASGKIVLVNHGIHLPGDGTDHAYLTELSGGSTPAEKIKAWTFPDTASHYLDYLVSLKGYDGGGLTLRLYWSSLATANSAVWQAAFRRFADDAEDLDSAHTYSYQTVTAAAPSAVNEIAYNDITFTDGTQMDSFAENEMAILRLLRDPANGSDSLANTAYLWSLHGYET